jgi:predicted Zn-dependent protease
MPHTSSVFALALLVVTSCASAPDLTEARQITADLLDTDPQSAASYLGNLHAELLEDTPLQLLRAEAAARTGDLTDAARRYAVVADHTATTALRDHALRNLAVVHLQADHPDDAYAALIKLSSQAQEDPDVQRALGVAATAAGRLDLARALRQAA